MKLFRIIPVVLLMVFVVTPSFSAKKAEKPSERSVMHNNKGVTALYQENDLDKAIFEFKTACELDPNYVEAWANLGLAYKQKGRLDDAVTVLKKAIDLDKKFATPYNTLGTVYFQRGNYNEAIETLELAIKYNKKYSDPFYNLGLIYTEQFKKSGDKLLLENAVAAFKNATDINSDHPYAHYKLANVYKILGKFEEAILRYKLALEIDPKLTDAWNNLADLYTRTGQTLKAQQALNNAMSADPDSSESHLYMGLNYLRDNNINMAVKEFNLVIGKDPTNELAYFNVGFGYYQLATSLSGQGKASEAKQAYQESNRAYESAFQLKPNYAAAAFNIGYNHQMMKDYNNAVTWYRKTIAIDAGFYRAYFSLGMVYQLLGNTTEAKNTFCTVVKAKPSGMDEDLKTAEGIVGSLGGCK